MKNTSKLFGIIASIAVVGFSFVACDKGTGPDGPDPEPRSVFSVSGTFDKGGGKHVAFKLADATSYSRAVSSNTYAVKGELEDEDFIIRLSGTYDPADRTYTASASAESLGIRYSINGAYDSSGNSAGSTATLLVKDQGTGEWEAVSYVVNEAAPVSITGTTVVDSQTGGMPEFARGNWYYTYNMGTSSRKTKILVNQWSMNMDYASTENGQTSYSSAKFTIMEVDSKGGDKYSVIFAYPVYVPTSVDQVVTAINSFFSNKGVTAIRVTDWANINTSPVNIYYSIDVEDDYGISWEYFSQSQQGLINHFYFTDHLDKYLISQKIGPTTKYGKYDLSGNNTEMTWIGYYTWLWKDEAPYSRTQLFNSLASARQAETPIPKDYLKWAEDVLTSDQYLELLKTLEDQLKEDAITVTR